MWERDIVQVFFLWKWLREIICRKKGAPNGKVLNELFLCLSDITAAVHHSLDGNVVIDWVWLLVQCGLGDGQFR